MSVLASLTQRANNQCELCAATDNLGVYEVPPEDSQDSDKCILVCGTCEEQLTQSSELDTRHWHCLKDSMWSQTPAVQITAWRLLKRLSGEPWAQDLFDMLYLDEDMLNWAEALAEDNNQPTLDSNGTQLHAGDNVTLIKDLDVKGAGFTAKRGTAVRNISLTNNPEHIEGRVNGTRIVLVSKYLKKTN